MSDDTPAEVHFAPSKHIPPHTYGSKHFYDLGCRHPACTAASTESKQRLRTRRYSERVQVGNDLIHLGLAPIDSTSPQRHGTTVGRVEFGCRCAPCRSSRHTGNVFASMLMVSPIKDPRWHRHLAHLLHGNFTLDLVVALLMFTTFAVVAHWEGIVHGWEFVAALVFAGIAATAHRPPGRHRVAT